MTPPPTRGFPGLDKMVPLGSYVLEPGRFVSLAFIGRYDDCVQTRGRTMRFSTVQITFELWGVSRVQALDAGDEFVVRAPARCPSASSLGAGRTHAPVEGRLVRITHLMVCLKADDTPDEACFELADPMLGAHIGIHPEDAVARGVRVRLQPDGTGRVASIETLLSL